MHRKNKNNILLLTIIVLVASAVALVFFFLHQKDRPPQGNCESPGLMAPVTLTLDGFVKRSGVIATGKIESIDNSNVIVKVTDVLKGKGLERQQSIIPCQSQVNPIKLQVGTEVLLFLEGKDTDVWALAWPYDGIMALRDGRAEAMGGKSTFSLDDVRKAIRGKQ